MARIRAVNSRPEIAVRSLLHGRGFRFRLHRRDLPGRPDIVLPKYRAVVFVHGCFWHRHLCGYFAWPKTRADFWRDKLEGNATRDQRDRSALLSMGWRVAVVWECALRDRNETEILGMLDSLSRWILGEADLFESPRSNYEP